jgi:hypothetical protein
MLLESLGSAFAVGNKERIAFETAATALVLIDFQSISVGELQSQDRKPSQAEASSRAQQPVVQTHVPTVRCQRGQASTARARVQSWRRPRPSEIGRSRVYVRSSSTSVPRSSATAATSLSNGRDRHLAPSVRDILRLIATLRAPLKRTVKWKISA